MSTQIRFVLAIALMIGVLVATNLLFPPVPPEQDATGADTVAVEGTVEDSVLSGAARPVGEDSTEERSPSRVDTAEGPPPRIPTTASPEPAPVAEEEGSERMVVVEGPLYRFTFSERGARLRGAELLSFQSFTRDGPVDLIPAEAESVLGQRIVVGRDTVDLRRQRFRPSQPDGLVLAEGDSARDLTFVYEHPSQDFQVELRYTFRPDSYLVTARGRIQGLERGILYTDLGRGIAFNESNREDDARAMAFVGNHLQEGIRATNLDDVEQPVVQDGPFLWAAFKSKYFVIALLAGSQEDAGAHLGGILARPAEGDSRARVTVTQALGGDGTFGYRLFMGPQDFDRLSSMGVDLEDVNPYGWRFFRPIIQPFTAIILRILTFLHENLSLAYGWVLMLFGVMMRVVLFPLNQKAMRAQLRNMAVQPLLKEIQEKHKDNPEKLQKEMMKLYKEHGFNPLAGCLPMLLPWPILITLFFVFQNTIELRGVPFLWIPDLSAADPFYVLPLVLMASMFLLQFISYRSMDEPNPQMKMMMWIMPLFMGFVFSQFAAGLNLYYATANIATLPQQIWIANERKKVEPVTAGTSAD